MSEYFEKAFAETIGNEGGYVNDPADPGGETQWGISKRAYPDMNIVSLTIRDAKAIYFHDYWDKLNLENLNSYLIAAEIFDTAINTGRRTAIRIAQRALNYLGEDLTEDGLIGPVTLAALNKWTAKDERALFVCLNGFQFMHYYSITQKRAKSKRFARGWTKRIQQYKEKG